MKSYLISKGKNPTSKGLIWLTKKMYEQMKGHNNLEPAELVFKTKEKTEPVKDKDED